MLSDLKYERCGNLWQNPFLDKPSWHPYKGTLLNADQWMGVGSTCKRNVNPEIVSRILDKIHGTIGTLAFNNIKIHLFGYKTTGLKDDRIKDRIHSADSFAYDFSDRLTGAVRTRKDRIKSAEKFGYAISHNNVQTSLDLVA